MLGIRSIFGGAKDDKSELYKQLILFVEDAVARHDHEELSFLLYHKEIIDVLKQSKAMGIREFERILLGVVGSSHSIRGRKTQDIDMVTAELLIKAGANTERPAYWIGGFDGPMEFYIKDTYNDSNENKIEMRKNPELKSQAEQFQEYAAVVAINQRHHTIRGKLAQLFQP